MKIFIFIQVEISLRGVRNVERGEKSLSSTQYEEAARNQTIILVNPSSKTHRSAPFLSGVAMVR